MAVPVTNRIITLYASNSDVLPDSLNASKLDVLSDSRQNLPQRAGLGNEASIAAAARKTHPNMQRRVKAFRQLSYAQHLLIANDIRAVKGGKHRTRICHRRRHFNARNIVVRLSPSEVDSAASLHGLQTCGSVWACPVCAPRIASQRGKEIQKALDWAATNNLIPVMLTLTARHTGEMSLDHIQSRFNAAWRFMTKSRAWRRFRADYGVEQLITAREILYSWNNGNGWHYHMHSLMFIRRDALRDAVETDMQGEMRPVWLAALKKHELDAIGEYGLNVTAHGDVPGKYLAKLGINPGADVTDARYEISGAGNKQGRSGVNIWSLLERASRRDPQGRQQAGGKLAEKCYLEYVATMQGQNWITWSRGFKKLVGVDEQPDEQLAETDDEPQFEDWLKLSPEQWRPVAMTREYAGLLSVAAQSRSKSAVLAFIDELADELESVTTGASQFAAGQSAAASGHTSPLPDEQRRSFSSSPPGNQDRRAEIDKVLNQIYRWRADRSFVRRFVQSPEIKARELALYDRLISDAESRLEALQHVSR